MLEGGATVQESQNSFTLFSAISLPQSYGIRINEGAAECASSVGSF
jgi:hypothetical protein